MKKRTNILLATLMAATLATSCGKAPDSAEASAISAVSGNEDVTLAETIRSLQEMGTTEETTQNDEETEKTTVKIYYGNTKGNGLNVSEEEIPELTPDKLISALAAHNIVSIDTKVQSFDQAETDGKKTLYLDLSKHFGEYIGMMGKSGEHIVIAGLTNTFLDNYQADCLVLTINTKNLKTKHNEYENPLTKYQENEQVSGNQTRQQTYELQDEVLTKENISIQYPQFLSLTDTDKTQKWNDIIKTKVLELYDMQGIQNCLLTYEITTQNAGIISIVFRGEYTTATAAYPVNFAYTYNFNLVDGSNMRLSDYTDISGTAEILRREDAYTLVSDRITKQEFQDYLNNSLIDDYTKLLEDYDYDFDQPNIIPTGYSYMRDDDYVLIMEVSHTLGDYVELAINPTNNPANAVNPPKTAPN